MLIVFTLASISISSPAQNLLYYPQEIAIDSVHNRFLVSNYGNGAIVAIDSEGNQSYFNQDAGMIDGIEVVGDILYGVGDDRHFLAYDLNTGNQVLSMVFPGDESQYLSSVASDSTGHLFISCPPSNEIYKFRISDGTYWTFASGNGLNRPNGMLIEHEKDRMIVVDDSPANSQLHSISLSDSTVSVITSTDFYAPDGITRDIYGSYYIGGYYLPGLYRMDSYFAGPPELIHEGLHMVYPTYDASDHSILVTHFNENTWERIPLASSVDEETGDHSTVKMTICPNPFNPTTTVAFDLAQPGVVNLSVYNLRGQRVTTLVDGNLPAGSHRAVWNGDDATGRAVGSGVYFIRMQTAEGTQVRKALLLK